MRTFLKVIVWLFLLGVILSMLASGEGKAVLALTITGLIIWGFFHLRKKLSEIGEPIKTNTTHANNASGSLFLLDGINDTLEVFENKVTITAKRNLSSVFIRGMKGSKSIPYTSITAVQFREADPINGYIQFSILGALESGGGVIAAISNENTCFFAKRDNALARQIRDYIETKIFSARTTNNTVPINVNIADELRKLSELNKQRVLSDEEFNKAKARLLG